MSVVGHGNIFKTTVRNEAFEVAIRSKCSYGGSKNIFDHNIKTLIHFVDNKILSKNVIFL